MPSSSPSLDRVRDAFERVAGPGRQSGQWITFACPCHDDHNNSAAIAHNASAGRTVIKCFAGCDDRDIMDAIAIRVRDLYDEPRTSATAPSTPRHVATRRAAAAKARRDADERRERTRAEIARRKADLAAARGRPLGEGPELVTSYLYSRADGTPAGSVCRYVTRYEHANVKDFRQFHWDGERRRYRAGGFEPVLYRLPEVRTAIADGFPVVLVEGEKDADRAATVGVVATCNAMGAGSFTAAHAEQLDGASTVVIVADRDEPGYRHAASVAGMLAGRVGRVVVVQAVEGKDLSDHLDAGYAVTDLEPVVLDLPAPATPAARPAPDETDRAGQSATRRGITLEPPSPPSPPSPAPPAAGARDLIAASTPQMRPGAAVQPCAYPAPVAGGVAPATTQQRAGMAR